MSFGARNGRRGIEMRIPAARSNGSVLGASQENNCADKFCRMYFLLSNFLPVLSPDM